MSAAPERGSTGTLFVVNRLARSGKSDLDATVAALADRWPTRVLSISDPAALASELDAALADAAVGRVVLAGGDGTLNAALPVLVRAERPVGVIPLGTANDFARTLALPIDPVEAALVVTRGRTRRVDVASVNGCLFVNAAGIGLGSDLHDEVTTRTKKLFGRLAYPLTVLKRGWSERPFHVVLSGDGLDGQYRVVQATVANGRYYGGGMTAHEKARIDDGEFDVLLIRARPLWQFVLYGLSLKTGVYDRSSPMTAGRARRFELRTHRPKSISTDGENRTQTPASFDMLPGALEVFVP